MTTPENSGLQPGEAGDGGHSGHDERETAAIHWYAVDWVDSGGHRLATAWLPARRIDAAVVNIAALRPGTQIQVAAHVVDISAHTRRHRTGLLVQVFVTELHFDPPTQ
jgi:hypothetical protein